MHGAQQRTCLGMQCAAREHMPRGTQQGVGLVEADPAYKDHLGTHFDGLHDVPGSHGAIDQHEDEQDDVIDQPPWHALGLQACRAVVAPLQRTRIEPDGQGGQRAAAHLGCGLGKQQGVGANCQCSSSREPGTCCN